MIAGDAAYEYHSATVTRLEDDERSRRIRMTVRFYSLDQTATNEVKWPRLNRGGETAFAFISSISARRTPKSFPLIITPGGLDRGVSQGGRAAHRSDRARRTAAGCDRVRVSE
jgi:hypothetical protein